MAAVMVLSLSLAMLLIANASYKEGYRQGVRCAETQKGCRNYGSH